jgi:hypothetical protein
MSTIGGTGVVASNGSVPTEANVRAMTIY